MNVISPSAIPPCQAACPINTDVRGYVSAIARGDIDGAIRIIRQVNPFPSVCGRICTRPCEGACRRAQVDESISIAALKRFAADHARKFKSIKGPDHGYDEKVAVIGGGPAGLTVAHDLALLGYRVTIFEAQNVLGGMLTEGIPEYRLPKEVVKEEVDYILSLGVEARTGLALGRDLSIEDLCKDYQAVFLAVGSQKSLVHECNGIDLHGIITAVEFLKEVSRGWHPFLGEHVVVVGGGHTAIDAARTCLRLGSSNVTIIYRRTLDEMPAGRKEVEDAEKEGINIRYLIAPVEFLGNGSVQKVRCIKMQLGELDESGRRRPVPVENSEFEIKADTVILAIGYIPEAETLKNNRLVLSKNGTVIVKDETGATDLGGIFAGGDVVSGPLSVVEAIASGKRSAEAIHRYFRNLPFREVEKPFVLESLDDDIVRLIEKSDRKKMPALPVERRIKNFSEVELGYSREQALGEAQRCLNCGAGALVSDKCASCLTCVRLCPYDVPVAGKEIAEIDISKCQACGICASECPASAIKLKLETREESLSELRKIVDKAKKEAPELVVIGYYCRYRSPSGFPENGVYWLGKFCTGRLDEFQLIYPFELGVDGVAVHMCKNEECRFRDGSKWLLTHIERAKKILEEIGLGANRLNTISEEEISEFIKSFEALGINPIRKREKVME
ncbi:MAG: FAD-dependent oxidoreductase [Nitrospirota bacterium]